MAEWKDCPEVESVPGRMSGAWLLKGTRVRVEDILVNAEDFTPEEIVAEIYPSLKLDAVQRVIAFAKELDAPRAA